MKHRTWPIHIWFLDQDLRTSAMFLTDKALLKSIDGCVGALLSAYFYMIGIRSKKFYDYFFSKENIQSTMDRFFPHWPLKKKPSFSAYGRKESKWCRSCLENYNCAKQYLGILLNELEFRESTKSDVESILNWIEIDMPRIELASIGLSIVVFPWKVVNPKFRRENVVDGYRLQFISTFEDNDPFKAYGPCKRDIPQFVLDYFNCGQSYES